MNTFRQLLIVTVALANITLAFPAIAQEHEYLDELRELAKLRDEGILSNAEFDEQKKRILDSRAPSRSQKATEKAVALDPAPLSSKLENIMFLANEGFWEEADQKIAEYIEWHTEDSRAHAVGAYIKSYLNQPVEAAHFQAAALQLARSSLGGAPYPNQLVAWLAVQEGWLQLNYIPENVSAIHTDWDLQNKMPSTSIWEIAYRANPKNLLAVSSYELIASLVGDTAKAAKLSEEAATLRTAKTEDIYSGQSSPVVEALRQLNQYAGQISNEEPLDVDALSTVKAKLLAARDASRVALNQGNRPAFHQRALDRLLVIEDSILSQHYKLAKNSRASNQSSLASERLELLRQLFETPNPIAMTRAIEINLAEIAAISHRLKNKYFTAGIWYPEKRKDRKKKDQYLAEAWTKLNESLLVLERLAPLVTPPSFEIWQGHVAYYEGVLHGSAFDKKHPDASVVIGKAVSKLQESIKYLPREPYPRSALAINLYLQAEVTEGRDEREKLYVEAEKQGVLAKLLTGGEKVGIELARCHGECVDYVFEWIAGKRTGIVGTMLKMYGTAIVGLMADVDPSMIGQAMVVQSEDIGARLQAEIDAAQLRVINDQAAPQREESSFFENLMSIEGVFTSLGLYK